MARIQHSGKGEEVDNTVVERIPKIALSPTLLARHTKSVLICSKISAIKSVDSFNTGMKGLLTSGMEGSRSKSNRNPVQNHLRRPRDYAQASW